jgi:hypothetical protein
VLKHHNLKFYKKLIANNKNDIIRKEITKKKKTNTLNIKKSQQ